jgi:hypothetical protein
MSPCNFSFLLEIATLALAAAVRLGTQGRLTPIQRSERPRFLLVVMEQGKHLILIQLLASVEKVEFHHEPKPRDLAPE